MSSAVIFFLMALVVGQSDAAAFTTLSEFKDAASCATAQAAVDGAIKAGGLAHVFCISSDDLQGLAKAAHR